jgi:uncharacterized coiled-coil protein SlyX
VVTWLHDDDTDYQPSEEPEGKRWVPTFVGALVLAMIGVGSAFGWHAYGGSPYPSFALGGSAAPEPKPIGLDEFHMFQQQSTAQMQSTAQALAAQQAEMKRLSDQMAAVSAKIDAIQSSIASARAAIPAAMPIPPKKPGKPKPVARISTGGAPLPPPVPLAH